MMTTIEVYQKAAELGLSLCSEKKNVLTVRPADCCPPDFVETLRAYKWHLLFILSLPFVMVKSKALGGELVFFCKDEATKATLIEAGALEWSIYTRDELEILVKQNRIKPFTADELSKLHEIKRTFNGKIAT
jgi:hypothetical protein